MRRIGMSSVWLLALAMVLGGCAAERPMKAPEETLAESPEYLTRSGMRQLKNGDAEGAVARFQEALDRNPGFFPALKGMAEAEASRGNKKGAHPWAEKALDRSGSARERTAARTLLMALEMQSQEQGWLERMESHWEAAREEIPGAGRATLLMGRGYQAKGQYLDALVCYRQVLDWGGPETGDADQALAGLLDELRAEPGTHAGAILGHDESVGRADLAVLLVEELALADYLEASSPKTYSGGFKTPEEFAEEAPAEPLPEDVAGHPFEADIGEVLTLGIRGLEPFPDGRFHPDEPVSRAGFSLVVEDVLVRIKDEPLLRSAFVGNSSPFPDVPDDHYAFNAMVVCTTRDFLAADLDGAFRPDAPVTGAEALIAIRRLGEEIRRKGTP